MLIILLTGNLRRHLKSRRALYELAFYFFSLQFVEHKAQLYTQLYNPLVNYTSVPQRINESQNDSRLD